MIDKDAMQVKKYLVLNLSFFSSLNILTAHTSGLVLSTAICLTPKLNVYDHCEVAASSILFDCL